MNWIILGDCIEEMKKFPANSVDGMVTDPPYGLSFMGKEWDDFEDNEKYEEWTRKWGKEALRILKPGAFGIVFGGTRVYHRMMCGLEDAGFEIRDTLMWLYVSGFPKGQDIAKTIDKYFGLEPKRGAMKVAPDGKPFDKRQIAGNKKHDRVYGDQVVTEDDWYYTNPQTKEAKQWNGYRTALKPAWEPMVLVQKPREGSFVENILKWNVGALNIDASRIPINVQNEGDPRILSTETNYVRTTGKFEGSTDFFQKNKKEGGFINQLFDLKGRYPTNVIIDELIAEYMDIVYGEQNPGKLTRNKEINRNVEGSEGVWSKERTGFKQHPQAISNYGDGGGLSKSFYTTPTTSVVYGKWGDGRSRSMENYNLRDGGGLSKFFYVPKAHKNERDLGLKEINPKKRDSSRQKPCNVPQNRNKPVKNYHPTVKPIKLLCYLIRMIKPPVEKPTIIDPFFGSGSTGIACKIELCKCIGIEKNPDYMEIAKKRLAVPIQEYQKYTDSQVFPEENENQTKIVDFKDWL